MPDFPTMTSDLRLSVVVPLYNEEESVPHLVEEVREALGGDPAWELVLVDDGSEDETYATVREEAEGDPRVRPVRLARNYGQTAAMQAGFDQSRGAVVVTLDGDLQNDPRDIPALVARLDEGYDLVVGYREDRKDRFLTRKVPSWVANRLIAAVTGVNIRDNGCSLKAYRRELLERLRLHGDQHRFIPALSTIHGARIHEMPVNHRPRRFGESKYGLSRTFKVLSDLLAVKLVTAFGSRPLRGFGAVAVALGFLGVVFGVSWAVAWMIFSPAKSDALVLPGAAVLFGGTSVYLFALGLVCETAIRAEGDGEAERAKVPLYEELG